jgi:thiol-disulfide isomerase/thioredoxin
MVCRTKAFALGERVRANASSSGRSALLFLFVLICILGHSAAGAELELRYYGATWCAPCHRVEPMVDRWVADHSDLRIVKLDYDAHKADRQRFELIGVPMLVLLDGDKVIAKYGQNAQKVADFASDRLEWWYASSRANIEPPPP